jgi:hypothetical protein
VSPRVLFYRTDGFVLTRDVLKKVAKEHGIRRVIVSYFWAIKYSSQKIDYELRCCGAGLFETATIRSPAISDARMLEIDAELRNFLVALCDGGRDVYLILDNPFGSELAPRSLLKRSLTRELAWTRAASWTVVLPSKERGRFDLA